MEITEALALVEKIIEEHRQITHGFQTLEQVANDVGAMQGLEAGSEAFMPGRFNQKQGLEKLAESLETIEQGLQAHFNREEMSLPAAVETYGTEELVSALRSLLLVHENLRNRLAHSKKSIAELTGGGLSRHVWEASAHGMRAYLSHTRKLLEAHAMSEEKLLHKLRDWLLEETKEKRLDIM